MGISFRCKPSILQLLLYFTYFDLFILTVLLHQLHIFGDFFEN